MSAKTIAWIVLAIIVIAGVLYYFQTQSGGQPEENVGIANPASTNCVNLGGTLEIVDGTEGQFGLCHLPDGRVCEEWALFRDGSCTVPEN
ncbi:DUF333 domain-containing protein [Candidatus Kaiserbacteria bacterium]|nr:DUF333 domain-containing protein [Candidatus Kaiserbacteria bacterium]